MLQGLSSRVAELLSHVHHALHPPALAILLLGQDESSAKAWFRDLLPPVANTHAWQVTLESWMLPVFRAMEADDAVAIDRVEAGLRCPSYLPASLDLSLRLSLPLESHPSPPLAATAALLHPAAPFGPHRPSLSYSSRSAAP